MGFSVLYRNVACFFREGSHKVDEGWFDYVQEKNNSENKWDMFFC